MVISYNKKEKVVKVSFPSRTRKGIVWTVTCYDNLSVLQCECEAAKKQVMCWHKRTALSVLERAFEIINDELELTPEYQLIEEYQQSLN